MGGGDGGIPSLAARGPSRGRLRGSWAPPLHGNGGGAAKRAGSVGQSSVAETSFRAEEAEGGGDGGASRAGGEGGGGWGRGEGGVKSFLVRLFVFGLIDDVNLFINIMSAAISLIITSSRMSFASRVEIITFPSLLFHIIYISNIIITIPSSFFLVSSSSCSLSLV